MPTSAFQIDIMDLIASSSLVTKLVILILLVLSVVSWAIIFYKAKYFRKAKRENRQFLEVYDQSDEPFRLKKTAERFPASPLANVFLQAIRFQDPGEAKIETDSPAFNGGDEPGRAYRSERLLRSAGQEILSQMEEYLSFLASTGNVSPFIGLFGTVLGIINAFQEIGRQGTASIAAVAPGVAEALLATAAGLFVAIPSVVAYNYFVNKLRIMTSELEIFTTECMILLEQKQRNSTVVRSR
ncbi:MAG TPA: MotA/TolQ/ExbB proton channel family protein [Nitrospiria bacterium]|nr:MotA/TolQ/ExbB proton channel family protein [Nitrospiria bacterium]